LSEFVVCIAVYSLYGEFKGQDYVHAFLPFSPQDSISKLVGILRSISASVIFEYLEVKKELRGGELWEDGYFARTLDYKVTADVIRKYIQFRR
jgi:putative transposase